MLKKLKIENYKKVTKKEYSLTKPLIVTGYNGKGKSTVIESLVLGLLGYLPEYSKKNQDIFTRCSNDNDMTIEIESSEGNIKRTFFKKGRSISQEIKSSFLDDEMSLTEKDSQIVKTLGINPIFFDISQFISLNSNEKSKLIYSLTTSCKDKKWLEEKLLDKLPVKIATQILNEYNDEYTVEDNIENILKEIISNKKSLQQFIVENSKTIEEVLSYRENYQFDDNIDNAIEIAEKEISNLKSKISFQEEVRKNLNELELKEQQIEVPNLNLQELKKEAEDISNELKQCLSLDRTALISEKEKLAKSLEEAKTKGLVAKQKALNIANNLIELKNQLDKIINLAKSSKCIVSDKIACNNSAIKDYISELTEKAETLNKEKKEYENSYRSYGNDYNVINVKFQEISNKLNELENNSKKLSDELNSKLKKNSILQEKFTKLESIKKAKGLIKDKIQDIDMLNKILNSKLENLKTLKETKSADIKARQSEQIVLQMTAKSQEANDKICSLKSSEKVLKELKLELITNGIKPFVDTMNDIIKEISSFDKVFVDTTKSKAIFGLVKENRKIPLENLSKGESIIFLITLLAAIYNESDQLKVLALDNIENLDKKNLTMLLSKLDKVSRYYDNIILVGNIDAKNVDNDIANVIDLNIENEIKIA